MEIKIAQRPLGRLERTKKKNRALMWKTFEMATIDRPQTPNNEAGNTRQKRKPRILIWSIPT